MMQDVTAAGNVLNDSRLFVEEYLSRHLKGAGNMSSIQFIDTATEVTEGGIINNFFFLKIKSSSAP